ncbi:Fibrillin-1 [Oryzias melastigma]|uniref:Fibrillin-1 n=1 Tax=Oryzias melastigma TaxID=30732 RepID=A0A834BZN9_ORYME|nr:Fibrillin-1 [Oryzias melastigma]
MLSVINLLCTGIVSEICRGPRCFNGQDWSRSCVGAQCRERTEPSSSQRQPHHSPQFKTGQVYPSYQQDPHSSQHQSQSAPLAPYTIIQPQPQPQRAGFTQPRRTNPRTITAEVFHPGCSGGTCPTTVVHRPVNNDHTAARECKGIGCKLPSRMRQKQKPCVGEECGTQVGGEGRGSSSPVHVTDRAAQFLDELQDFGSDNGAFIQLTCDMKPGSNEVPSEDALVLQLQLSKSQERLVDALKGQQNEVKELQRLLSEQQGALVSQQREILEQQRRMFEQMEQVKAQYNILMDSMKHTSVQQLLDSHVETLSGQMRRHQTQEALSFHKVDMEASVVEVGHSQLACGSCGPEEYCSYSNGHPRCEKCTVCPPGFFLVAQCSVHADRICQDRDECLEMSGLCGDQQKCSNTPGGFRCQGMTMRDAASGLCGHGYFFNSDMDECQACSECDGEPVAAPCSVVTDTVCLDPAAAPSEVLSLSWAGDLSLQGAKDRFLALAFPSMQLHVQGRGDVGLVIVENGYLVLREHGLVWLDGNLGLSHGCRSFIQVCVRLNDTDGSNGHDLSGVRVEQREQRSIQSVSISVVAEVAPGQKLSIFLRSASHHCNQSSEGLQLYDSSAAPLNLLWLSHDTGAVAMTAQAMVSAHYHTNYRPVFRTTSTSDPYVMGLTHDGRGIRFAESGAVRFVFQQALYSMGQACISEGFQLVAYLNHNATGTELFRVFKPGVHYRDTSISLSGTAKVSPGDAISFEILSPAQCNVRFFGDETGISLLSLFWVPAAISSSMSASVANTGLPSGAVRNKPLFFRQTTPQVSQIGLLGKGSPDQRRDFVFKESGTVSLALDLKLIHSCNLVKVTLLKRSDADGPGQRHDTDGTRPVALAQQVAGQMPEGSEWASVSLRASFRVHNGTAVFFILDCVRGRVNQISHQTGSGVSVLWVAA